MSLLSIYLDDIFMSAAVWFHSSAEFNLDE